MKKKISESISLKLRKKWITSNIKTFLLVISLILAYFAINVFLEKKELPTFDITENKIYTLTEESKEAVKKVNQDVKVFVYGYAEDATVMKLLRQYNECNNKITYEIINSENNMDKVSKYALEPGNQAVILEVGETNKLLFSNDFFSYDNTTWEQIDTTENTLTNSILNLTIVEKPKVYFLTGHEEVSEEYLVGATVNLQNSLFEVNTLNLLTSNGIPEKTDLIIVLSPKKDLYEQEYTILESYINNGGNLLYASDLKVQQEANTNWQRILDLYGASIPAGMVLESDKTRTIQDTPYAIIPMLKSSDVTSSVYADKTVLVEYAQKIVMKDEATLKSLNVEYTNILNATEKSIYQQFTPEGFVQDGEMGEQPIGTYITKTINSQDPNSEPKQSKLIVLGTAYFLTDLPSEAIYLTNNGQYVPQYQLNDNIEVFINFVSGLTDRKDTVFIKKDTSSTAFTPTTSQANIVLVITFVFPVIIIIIGIIVWNIRKRKK